MSTMDREVVRAVEEEKDRPENRVAAGCRRSSVRWLLAALCITAASGVSQSADSGSADSASRGRKILEARECLACHSLAGEGAGTAPDLARRSTRSEHSPAGLAALMWSHGPDMWDQMRQRSMQVKPLSRAEADDLFAYFWSLRYFDLRGEAVRGKEVFAAKKCDTCHSLTEEAATGDAPPVTEWAGLSDPMLWAQQLWNHSSSMERSMEARGMAWPEFSEREMVDLLIYLQNLPTNRDDLRQLELSAPPAARAMFHAKACATCHSFDRRPSDKGSLSGSRKEFNTITGFTAAMWNHAPRGGSRGPAMNEPGTAFSVDEMGGLISHVYYSGGFEEVGNPAKGRSLFVKKGCQSCHGEPHQGAGWIGSGDRLSSASMVAAVWSHGPEMLEEMQKSGREWPTLSGREVADLIAYLNAPR